MMSQWRLDGLIRRLPDQSARVVFVLGGRDAAVPPTTGREAAAVMRDARVVEMPGLGHLAHEEDAGGVVAVIREAMG